jgi:hypothetical protein
MSCPGFDLGNIFRGVRTMVISGNLLRGGAAAALAVGLSAALTQAARASNFELTLSGVFNGTGAITDTVSGAGAPTLTLNEPFTLTGIFNTASPNLIAGLPPPVNMGWVDYAPTSVKLTVGGTTYSVATYDSSIPLTGGTGLTIAVFDTMQIFGPGHYGVGFIQNPIQDGAGIVGDFQAATPNYTVPNLVNTTYSDYFGVGFGSGVCSGGGGSGVGCVTTPIPLDGKLYELTLGTYDLNNPSNGIPQNPGPPPAYPNSNLFSASLTVVPEPSTWALMLVGFAGLSYLGLRRGRKERLAV